MNPVGAPLKKRNRRNPLEEQIKATQINPMFHGGYYILEKVQLYKDDSSMFVDIWVLLESIENDEQLKALKELNERYQNSLLPKSKRLDKLTGPVGGN